MDYAVSGDAEGDGRAGWTVTETGRTPFAPPKKDAEPDPAAEARPIELAFLGSIPLGSPPKIAGPVRDVGAFDLDDRGRIGFVRRTAGGSTPEAFVLIDPAAEGGSVLLERPLGELADPSTASVLLAWTGGDRWVLIATRLADDGPARAWTIDAATGDATPLPRFDAPHVESIDGTGDGGFAGLVVQHGEYTITEWLARFDADGRTLWRVEESSEDSRALFSPDGVAVSAAGRVGVVSAVGEDLRVFSPDGRHLRTIELEDRLGREPNYPSDLYADGPSDDPEEDRWILHDFLGSPPVVRLGPGGSGNAVRAALTPRFPDGRACDFGEIRQSPRNGRLWTTDGDGLHRLDAAHPARCARGPELALRASIVQGATVPHGPS